MSNYFKPLRRKIGVATLVLACLFLVVWMRSIYFEDSLYIGNQQAVELRFKSSGGGIWFRPFPAAHLGFGWAGTKFQWNTVRHKEFIELEQNVWSTRYIIKPISWTWPQLHFVPDTTRNPLLNVYLETNYWIITLPLSLLSAWLLLGKPRTTKQTIVAESNSACGT